MPRKAFLNDLRELSEELHIEGISDVERGEDDGHVMFNVQPLPTGPKYQVTVIVSDVSDYPSDHYYFLSAQDDAPKDFASTLERMSNTDVGQRLPDLLQALSNKLSTTDADGDTPMPDSQVDDSDFEDYDDESADEFDDDVFDANTNNKPFVHATKATTNGHTVASPQLRAKIRANLLATKNAGFKVGVHGGLFDGVSCFVSVSCRIGKLGISDEAMQAWEVDRNDYLILLINYQNGYKPMQEIIGVDSVQARRDVKFVVGISSTYKPTLQEAVNAFNTQFQQTKAKQEAVTDSQSERRGFRHCFISRPLNQLFDDRLVKLLAYREMGMPWTGAERFYNDNQGKQYAMSDALADQYLADEPKNTTYPDIVTDDHFRDARPGEHAFPLVAMQFLLRHFVRCNEFCLVCHCKTDEDLGAIKPYVCEKPLCLYQYMSLGFGPSIEHEIMTQPYVVDLLVSFCYSQARTLDKLHIFPTGLGLLVPPTVALPEMQAINNYSYRSYTPQNVASTAPPTDSVEPKPVERTAKFNHEKLELLFESGEQCPVRVGDWIVIPKSSKVESHLHCHVASTTYFPTIHLSEPVLGPAPFDAVDMDGKDKKDQAPPRSSNFESAVFYIYEQNFDTLTDAHKREIIVQLLDLLPDVQELREYIKSSRKELSAWVQRLSPALASLLRWIIASCRACIFQVDDPIASPAEQARKGEHRLHGMPGWMQFRFAMGAPDKERRFINAVNQTSARLSQTHPTIFAWHGSALVNWHSIIREGLHYNYIACGRAYGDGVYHALDYNTSAGYSNSHAYNYNRSGNSVRSGWPSSKLNITSVLALSEIVNAPTEFKCSNPHLVVQHLDWIQTRYLFVQCGNPDIKLEDAPKPPKNAHPQDPAYTPQGCAHTPLVIPATAVSRLRRPRSEGIFKKITKKLKPSLGSASDPIELDDFDDTASIQTLQEDLAIFETERAPTPPPMKLIKAPTRLFKSSKPMTDFVPGHLDVSTLPLLQPPAYASPFGTKRLLSDFKAMTKAQETQPLHELGWYLNNDPDLMTNLYQWIIELHTFDQSLPLAKDMKQQKITSVVLEIRFGRDFPISPPFVRVIRPRFLGFQQGGGGHVTLGGAICMELLTNNGWTAACTIESVLMQIKMAMESTDPRPARLAGGSSSDYGMFEAVEAFERACRTHGWTIPADLRETTKDTAESSRDSHAY